MYAGEHKKSASRRSSTSIASACSSVSSRISDVSLPSSRASSITTQASLVSRYLRERDTAMSASNAHAAGINGPANPVPGHAKYSEIMEKAEFQPVVVSGESKRTKSRRIVNLSLRKMTAAERDHYDARVVGGKQTFCIDKALATESGLYMPAAGYMLDFDIVRNQKSVPCTVRLSCCSTPGRNIEEPLLHILRYSQRQLETAATSVELPQGICLEEAQFPCGITGSRSKACSAQLAIDGNIAEDVWTVRRASVSSFTYDMTFYGSDTCSDDERKQRNLQRALSSGNYAFTVAVRLPKGTIYRPGAELKRIQWNKLQGLEKAFPDWLYARDDETVKQWLGPSNAKGQYEHFEVQDVKLNLRGEVLSARLVKVAGTKYIKPPRSAPAPAPIPSTPTTPVLQRKLSETQIAAQTTGGRKTGRGMLSLMRRG
jgi:hypothetical protein